jgi:hypothetical protein
MNFTMDPLLLSVALLFTIVFVLIVIIFQLNSKLNKFLIGNGAESLENSISNIDNSIRGLEMFKTEMENYLASVEKRLKKSVQAVHTVRFNPFQGTTGSGGNQSFATAFLNDSCDGVIISSLYSREHVSIFAKPVVRGVSEYELSSEERQAIDTAMKMVK